MNTEKLKEFKLASWCIENRTVMYVLLLVVALWGTIAYIRLPKELYPDIVIPTISVATIYPGASPEDVENLVSKPIEKQLKSINGIKKVTSTSLSDVSIITAEFSTDLDPALCKQKVSDAVDKVKGDLPTDILNDPAIQEFDISEAPIMNINLYGDLPLHDLKGYAETVQDRVEGLKEITRVDIIGGLEREVQVNIDLYKMTAYDLSLYDIETAIQRENLNISGGEVKVGDLRRNLRVTGEFQTADDIGNIVVKSFTGNFVAIKDIGTVTDGYKEKQDFARLNGKPVITLNVIKRSGSNLIDASDGIYAILDELEEKEFPQALNVEVTGDQSELTRTQLDDLINTVIIGFVLVLVILMFFMGFNNAFFVALSVPLASLLAFSLMPVMDMSMNVIVLFSFLLALGIIVDDAIVVIENTHRIFHKFDFDIKQATKYAAGEVFQPVLSGTLTTLAPFVPLLFWPGIVGKFMSSIPITLIITLAASLIVAFFFNTVFAVDFMKKEEKNLNKGRLSGVVVPIIILVVIAFFAYLFGSFGIGNFAVFLLLMVLLYNLVVKALIEAFQEKFFPWLMNIYRNVLQKTVRGLRPVVVVLSTFVLLIFSVIILALFGPSTNFFPDGDPNFVYVYAKFPNGTDATVTDSVTQQIEKRVYKVIGQNNPVVSSVITNVGLGAGDPNNPDKVATPHKSKVTIAFKKFRERNKVSTRGILNDLRAEFKSGVPGAEITVEKEANGPPVGKPISIEISGEDYAVIGKIQDSLLMGIRNARIEGIDKLKSDLQISKPEILLVLDKEKMQREGVSLGQVGGELRTALFGKEVSKFRDADDDAPIMLRLSNDYRKRVEDLMNLHISYFDMSIGQFRQIPVSSFASLKYQNSVSEITRKNQSRVVTLSSDVEDGFTANDINPKIAAVIQGLNIPDGYEINQTGADAEQKETSDFLGMAFGAAALLMLIILVTQFNSVVKPLIIFNTILFSLIGVFLGFTITGMSFSIVMTGVGVFALAGIVIRNGILVIEFIDELRSRGLSVEEAVIEGGATRLTPVILTALAAILGLIPLAIGLNIDFAGLFAHFEPEFFVGGDQVVFWGPLAWTMIFGLIVATFLTLIVLPNFYMMGYKVREALVRWFPAAAAFIRSL